MMDDYRLQLRFFVRTAKASRVRQLKSDNQVVCSPETLPVRLDHFKPKSLELAARGLIQHKLIRVRPRLRQHRNRLAAPQELGAAQCNSLPAPAGKLRRASIAFAVPALHGVRGKAIADNQTLRGSVNL